MLWRRDRKAARQNCLFCEMKKKPDDGKVLSRMCVVFLVKYEI